MKAIGGVDCNLGGGMANGSRVSLKRNLGPMEEQGGPYVPMAGRPSVAVLHPNRSHSMPLTIQRPNDRQSPSTPRASEAGLDAPPRQWSLVSLHPMQLDHHCAPRSPPHRVEDVNCGGRGLQAETAVMYRLPLVLHDAQRKTRSTSRSLIAQASVARSWNRSPPSSSNYSLSLSCSCASIELHRRSHFPRHEVSPRCHEL